MTMRGIARGMLLRSAADGIALVCGFATFAYLSRRLGSSAYGDYSVAYLLAAWCTDILGSFAGPSTARMVAGHVHGRRFANTMLRAAAVGGAVIASIVIVIAPAVATWFRSPAIEAPLRWLGAGIPMTAMTAVHATVVLGHGMLSVGPMALVAAWACRLAAAVILVEAGFGPAGAAASVLAGDVVRFAVLRHASDARLWGVVRMPLNRMMHHARLLVGTNLAMRALGGMDLIAVKLLAPSADAAGLYAAAQNVCLVPALGFNGSAGVISRSIAAARRLPDVAPIVAMATAYLRLAVLSAGVTVAMIPLAPAIAVFLLGERFTPSGVIAQVLLAATAFRMLATGGRAIASGLGERRIYLVGLTALAMVGAAVFAWRAPAIAGRFATRGVEPMLGYAVVTAALALASAIGCLGAGVCLTKAAFPWPTLARAAVATACGAATGWMIPWEGLAVLPRIAVVACTYLAVVSLLGERLSGIAALSPRARHEDRSADLAGGDSPPV